MRFGVVGPGSELNQRVHTANSSASVCGIGNSHRVRGAHTARAVEQLRNVTPGRRAEGLRELAAGLGITASGSLNVGSTGAGTVS